MQKVYLLLRSNQQSGPFSLEELIQFDLKPFDLIWIEGKSAGWYYPQEIQALRSHLSFLQAPTVLPAEQTSEVPTPSTSAPSKKIFVSMPASPKQETVSSTSAHTQFYSQPAAAKPMQPIEPANEEGVKTAYAKTLDEVETNYMNRAYQKKTKKKSSLSVKGAIAACLLVGVAIAAWVIMDQPSVKPETDVAEQNLAVSAESEPGIDSSRQEEQLAADKNISLKKKKTKPVVATKKAAGIITGNTATEPAKEMVINTDASKNEYEVAPPVIKEESKIITEENAGTVTDAPKEKKKLREKILDLFKKKPKEENTEETKPVTEENGQRNSTRREGSSNLAQLVKVQFTIPNDWMMGIKGAKATLTNRSSEAVAKAVVEVIYYNDENEILDKRTISFNGIKSKQSQTVSIPDHAVATRLEYNVISATAPGEPFAKL